MGPIDLNELAKRESERVEWKENVADIQDLIKTIVAFTNDYSNLGGGYAVCGAKEARDAYGFKTIIYRGLTASRINEITGKVLTDCRTKVNPEVIPLTSEIPVPGDDSRRILVFIVPATTNAHSYRINAKDASTYYIRSGDNTIEARNGLLRELLIRKRQLEPWDRRLNTQSTITDIDLITFREYLQEMKLWSTNKSLEDYISDKDKLSDFTPPLAGKIGLDKNLKLRNFTILMFGKKPLDYFYGAYTTFSTYKGKDRSEPTGERQMITGTIVQQAKQLIDLLNVESYTVFDKTTNIPNQVKYPIIALKEAVVNAIVHRDYESDQPVKVTVFSDRVEIFSPGGLPVQVDVEKFKLGKATAYWRNQALNYLFNRLQLAQAEGQGISTILKAMRDEQCPDPIFDIQQESVTCILPAHPRHQLLREIYDVENKIILRNYPEAFTKLEEILNQDMYNLRALELYCQVNTSLENPKHVYEFIKNRQLDLDKINPGTMITIAETLASISGEKEIKEFAETILHKAINSRIEEKQLEKVIFSLKKIVDPEKLENIITGIFKTHPEFVKNVSLLQHRARVKIDLAKICETSAKDRNLSHRIKARAWEQLRTYLAEAEKDLSIALEYAPSPVARDWLLKDLNYLQNMKNDSEKPKREMTKVYISNLPVATTKKELAEVFSKFGKIREIIIPDQLSKKISWYAFIDFYEKSSVINLYKSKDDLNLQGNRLTINEYYSQKKQHISKRK